MIHQGDEKIEHVIPCRFINPSPAYLTPQRHQDLPSISSFTGERETFMTKRIIISIAIYCAFLTGCGSSPYDDGFAEGRDFGSKIAEVANRYGKSATAYIESAPSVNEMRASGVPIPYQEDEEKQKHWEKGYSDGLKSVLKN